MVPSQITIITIRNNLVLVYLNMFILQRACEVQLLAQAGGVELIPIPQLIVAGIKQAAKEVTRNAGGKLAWPGLLRKLERIGAPYAS